MMNSKNFFINAINNMVEGRERRVRGEIAQYRKLMRMNKDTL